MKLFAIRNDDRTACAYLMYFPRSKEFVIELPANADPWETPVLLSSFAEKGIFSIDPYHSRIWVQQRIVPYERQNIGQVLKDNGLKAYDDFSLLVKADGRCAQDDYYIERLDVSELPREIKNRSEKRIDGAVPLGDGNYLLTFYNGKVKKCDVRQLVGRREDMSAFIKTRPDQLDKARISAGGCVLGWGEKLYISYTDIYDAGKPIPLSGGELKEIICQSIADTAEVCEILGCTRQYVNELVVSGKLRPIKTNEKSTLFLRSDVTRKLCE